MSTKPKSKAKKTTKPKTASSIVWFEIPADNLPRARKFYSSLFGWKMEQFPGMMDYWHMATGGHDKSPDGGMLPRMYPRHTITNYISVASVAKSSTKVLKLGGKIMKNKTAVPHMGYFVICRDTEGNEFALWEVDPKAQ